MVGAPARDHAGAELLAAEPARAVVAFLRVNALLRVVHVGGRAQPHLVVEVLRDGHLGLLGARGVAGEAYRHRLELADAPVADELGRVAELGRGALLAADLEDAPGAVDRVAEGPALGDRERGRLLEVDVLAGLDGGDRGERVPVIRCADEDGVHVLVRQQLPVVGIGRDAIVGPARLLRVVAVHEDPRVLDPPAVEVADGHDPGGVVLPHARHVVRPRDAPGADRAHVDAVAGGGRPEDRGGNDDGEAGGEDGRSTHPPGRHRKRLPARHLPPACHRWLLSANSTAGHYAPSAAAVKGAATASMRRWTGHVHPDPVQPLRQADLGGMRPPRRAGDGGHPPGEAVQLPPPEVPPRPPSRPLRRIDTPPARA